VAGVLLDNGTTLPADLVVVGVGARPNSELFKGQLALDKGGGISVDGSLAASVPGVYAIGDVASFPLAREGGALGRQEHVTHARQSAAHVGATLMGEWRSSSAWLSGRLAAVL
jgi:monodehydroascorbate reductase (NADH)